MDWVWYLFKFEGRLNRAKYWLAGLIIVCWMIFLMLLLYVPVGYLFGWPAELSFDLDNIFAIVDPNSFQKLSQAEVSVIVVNVITMPLFLWVFLATSVKRLHDRDKSGWWIVLFFFLPGLVGRFEDRISDSILTAWLGISAGILYMWGVVELYFRRGSPRTNLYGANPLPKVQNRSRSAEARLRATTSWDQDSEIEMLPHIGSPPTGMHVNRGT
jgi:uncharacterized membrane protein YhaH (DUF805 family)